MQSRERLTAALHSDAEILIKYFLDAGASVFDSIGRPLDVVKLDFEAGRQQTFGFSFDAGRPVVEVSFSGISCHANNVQILHWGRVYCSGTHIEKVLTQWKALDRWLSKTFARRSVRARSLRGKTYAISVLVGPDAAEWVAGAANRFIFSMWDQVPADDVQFDLAYATSTEAPHVPAEPHKRKLPG